MTEHDELLLLRALLRASDYGVLLSDDARRDQVGNRRFFEMFGLDGLEALRDRPESVRAALGTRLRDPEGFLKTLDEVYADPARTLEDEVALSAPRPRLLRRYTAPVHDDAGAIIGRLWTFLDVTRARGMEDKIRAQSAQLREQSRALAAALRAVTGRLDRAESTLSLAQRRLFEAERLSAVGLLAASTAHDIRNLLTPLAIELSLIELSLAEPDDPEMRRESLDAMRHQVDGLALLTHRLLALAMPETTERAPTDLATLSRRIQTLVGPQAASEGVSVAVRAARGLPPVPADAVQMEQVLVNLVLNAIQAMRATSGGRLTLTLDRQTVDTDRAGVRLRVADTGPGIAPAARRRLFDPFVTTRPDGAGLGLFSCRRIVEAHGGAISARARPGGGAQFTVWLPRG